MNELQQIVTQVIQGLSLNPEAILPKLQLLASELPEVYLLIEQGIMELALQGDQNALQAALILALAMDLQQLQLPLSARLGAKLNYIKELKGICPEGYEITYMKAGSKVCPVCLRKAAALQEVAKKACGGSTKTGAVSKTMEDIKQSMRCGGSTKTKKCEIGGSIDIFKCGGKKAKKCEDGETLDNNKKKQREKIQPTNSDTAHVRGANDGKTYVAALSEYAAKKFQYPSVASMVGNKKYNLKDVKKALGKASVEAGD